MGKIDRTITMAATKTEKLAKQIYDAAYGFGAAAKSADEFIARLERMTKLADKFNGKITLSVNTSAYDKLMKEMAKTEEKRIKIVEEFDRPHQEVMRETSKVVEMPGLAEAEKKAREYYQREKQVNALSSHYEVGGLLFNVAR